MSDATDISIVGLDRAEVLAALYNHARPFGMGIVAAEQGDMSPREARQHLDAADRGDGTAYFDYLKGRLLKVEIATTFIDGRLFDRDYGHGMARKIVEGLRV